MNIDYVTVGKRIKHLRRQLHITQADLAKQVDLSTSFCGHIERGTRIPSLESILRISGVLGITVDELLTGLPIASETYGNGSTFKIRILNDIMNVLYKNSDDWLPLDP